LICRFSESRGLSDTLYADQSIGPFGIHVLTVAVGVDAVASLVGAAETAAVAVAGGTSTVVLAVGGGGL
jgi:hypothetical protein